MKKITIRGHRLISFIMICLVSMCLSCTSKVETVSEQLGIPEMKMDVVVWKSFSSLKSEIKYLKAYISKEDSKKFKDWIQENKTVKMNEMYIGLDNHENVQGWDNPKPTKSDFYGDIKTQTDDYKFMVSFLIKDHNNKKDVLYIEAFDSFDIP